MNDHYNTQYFLQIDFNRAISTRFAPRDKRQGLLLICFLDHELGKIRYQTRDPLLRRIKTQFWREALFEENGTGHLLAHELIAHLSADSPVFSSLEDLVRVHEERHNEEELSPEIMLQDYCQQQAALFEVSSAYLLAPEDRVNSEFYGQCGLAYGIAQLLVTKRGQLADTGRGLTVYFEQSREAYAGVIDDLQMLDPRARAAVLPLALVPSYLDLFRTSDNAPGEPIDLHPVKKVWMLWRAARNGFS